MNKPTIKEFLEAIKYRITGGDEYMWDTYGPTARYLDYEVVNSPINDVSASAVYDIATQAIYEMQVWDANAKKEYRWINPLFAKAYKAECKKRGSPYKKSVDGRKFIDLDLASDILEKITAIVDNKPYDTRVQIELELSDDEISVLMTIAHERDITLNQLVEKVLEKSMNIALKEARHITLAKQYKQFIENNAPLPLDTSGVVKSSVLEWALANKMTMQEAKDFLKFMLANS